MTNEDYKRQSQKVALFELTRSGRLAVSPTAWANPDGSIDAGGDKDIVDAGREVGRVYITRSEYESRKTV
jgi:hypothetical protein